MKKMKFFFMFYRQNLIAVLILLYLMTISIFNMVELVGEYNYYTYTLKYFTEHFNKGIYYMPSVKPNQDFRQGNWDYNELKSKKWSAVERIVNPPGSFITYEDNAVNIIICDEDFLNTGMSFSDDGVWFTEDSTNYDLPIDVVVSGYMFQYVKVGDVIELPVYNLDNTFKKTMTANVIGKDHEPSYTLSLGYSADQVSTTKLFGYGGHNGIYMTAESFKRVYEIEDQDELAYRSENNLICFRDGASEGEIQEVVEELSTRGICISFEDIKAFSKEEIEDQLREKLPMPLFMLIVSTFSMISVGILITERQMDDYKIYFLCGCSRRKSFANIFSAIMLIGFIASAINVAYVLLFPHIFSKITSGSTVEGYLNYFRIMSNDIIIYILGYVLAASLLSVIVPFILMRKKSAMMLYNRR